MPVENDEAQLVVPGIKRRNNEMWKKIAEVQNEHQNFLQKLGFVEAQATHARFIDPAIADEAWKAGKGKFMGHGLPWKNFEPSSPKDERRQIFESFNRAEFELPDSAQTIPDLESNGSNKSGKHMKNSKDKYMNKSSVFHGTTTGEDKKSEEKYVNAKAKVDSGLRQKRAIRLTRKGVHDRSPSKPNGQPGWIRDKSVPLTLASKLPDYVGKNRSIIPSVIIRKPTPVGAHSRGTIKNYLDSMNVYTTYEQIKREKTQKLNVITNQPNAGKSLISGNSNKPSGYWEYQSNQAKNASANYDKFLSSIMYTGNPVQILKPPPARSFYIPGLTTEESTQQVQFGPKQQAALAARNGPALAAAQSSRKSDPARLLPRHVPGPKYDNIYIGPYSGSESDRERGESVERKVRPKSQRR